MRPAYTAIFEGASDTTGSSVARVVRPLLRHRSSRATPTDARKACSLVQRVAHCSIFIFACLHAADNDREKGEGPHTVSASCIGSRRRGYSCAAHCAAHCPQCTHPEIPTPRAVCTPKRVESRSSNKHFPRRLPSPFSPHSGRRRFVYASPIAKRKDAIRASLKVNAAPRPTEDPPSVRYAARSGPVLSAEGPCTDVQPLQNEQVFISCHGRTSTH